nr:tropomyosin alpha-1 chain-like [Aegilops tauschii subsp. strangulata]
MWRIGLGALHIWKQLFKAQKCWPMETKDIGLDIENPSSAGSTKKAEQIDCLTPLSEDPTTPHLTEMLVSVSYKASEKKAKKKGKEAKGGPRHKGPSEASLLAATAQATEVSELNRKLQLADEEIDRVNKRFDETQVGAAEVETLKGALATAQQEAEANKAAADKAAAELKTEQTARRQHEARVAEVEQELRAPSSNLRNWKRSLRLDRPNSTKPNKKQRRHGSSPEVLSRRSVRRSR